jgi:hypothetical protein
VTFFVAQVDAQRILPGWRGVLRFFPGKPGLAKKVTVPIQSLESIEIKTPQGLKLYKALQEQAGQAKQESIDCLLERILAW